MRWLARNTMWIPVLAICTLPTVTLVGHAEVRTLSGHSGRVNGVQFSPDGKVVASGSSDGTVRLWDTGTEAVRHVLTGHKGAVNSIAFSSDGKTVVSGGADKMIMLWDAQAGKLRGRLKGHGGAVYSVALSPDGKILASGGARWRRGVASGEVKLWDVQTGKLLRALREVYADSVDALAFSPDGKVLVTGGSLGSGGHLTLWDVLSGERLAKSGEMKAYMEVTSVAFSPDGKTLAHGEADHQRVLNILLSGAIQKKSPEEIGDELKQQILGGLTLSIVEGMQTHRGLSTRPTFALAFSPCGRVLASGMGQEVMLWDPQTGELKRTLKGHGESVHSVAFSPDGKMLATGGSDNVVRLWPIE